MNNEFLSGFVCIIGCPNVGKSTLLNAFAGQKIAIVSKRAQTTRNRIHGVLNRSDFQIVFIDTPGLNKPKNKLGEFMIRVANEALNEVECVLYVVDATLGIKQQDEAIMQKLSGVKSPVIAAINKTDSASMAKVQEIQSVLDGLPWINKSFCISALNGDGLETLIAELKSFLPAGPKYYPDDMVTDQPERVICAEFIREKALLLLEEEIPHGIGVEIDKIEQRNEELIDMYATIYCERDAHKGIVIGKNGSMLKKIGTYARKDIEWLLGCRVNLQLWVKVKVDWRNNNSQIKMLGYE